MNTKLDSKQQEELLQILKLRFENNMHRHKNVNWSVIQTKLEANPDKLWSLYEMEKTGGEPDVVTLDTDNTDCIFYDCASESPKERRSLCYDKEALESRKKFKPKNNAIDLAAAIGIELVTEVDYRKLQQIESFDNKTSSWLKTPDKIRKLGGAIFGDYRFGQVFIYHNGAESYYAGRGFRGKLKI